jgi:hypothetical protein
MGTVWTDNPRIVLESYNVTNIYLSTYLSIYRPTYLPVALLSFRWTLDVISVS